MTTPIELLEALAEKAETGYIEKHPEGIDLWCCSVCGFGFDAAHHIEGDDSCPCCFEAAVAPLLPDLLGLARFCQHMDFECEDPHLPTCREQELPREQWCESCRAAAARDALFGKEGQP